jgi:hypothetical protein
VQRQFRINKRNELTNFCSKLGKPEYRHVLFRTSVEREPSIIVMGEANACRLDILVQTIIFSPNEDIFKEQVIVPTS